MSKSLECGMQFLSSAQANDLHTLKHQLASMENDQMLLLSSRPHNEISSHVEITPTPERQDGRFSSFGVHFADLELTDLDQHNPSVITQPVAIKPHESIRQAVRELQISRFLNQHKRRTFNVIGFMKNGGDNTVSTITEFEQGVVSFDNILLNERRKNSPEQIKWALGCAASTLKFLHLNGVVHGDFQVRNTAFDVSLQPRIIDISEIRKTNEADFYENDVLTYVESLTNHGTHLSPVSNDQFLEYFLKPYSERIENSEKIPRCVKEHLSQELGCLAANLADLLPSR